MKHAINRGKSIAKPKAKTLTQTESIKKTKPAAKKAIDKFNLKSTQQKPVRAAKSAVKQVAPKLSAKTLNGLKTISVRKVKPVNKLAKEPKTKKAAPKTSAKMLTISARKTKQISSAKKATAVQKKPKKITTAQKINSKTAVQPKIFVKPIIKSSVKTAKNPSSKVSARAAKLPKPTVEITVAAKIKAVRNKTKLTVAAKNSKKAERKKTMTTAKTTERKKIAPPVPTKKDNQKSKKIHPTVLTKKTVRKTVKAKPVVAAKKTARKIQKFNPAVSGRVASKKPPKTGKSVSPKKIKTPETTVEIIEPRPRKPKNKKAKPISSAIFRGRKERYDFKVFALNEKFDPIPAVYIISKRKTDKRKKGHHALICIGETASIADEIKRHRKGKCVKKHQANAVSILPEANEQIRLKIENDLKSAHIVACNFE